MRVQRRGRERRRGRGKAKAIKAFVDLAAERGQQTYINKLEVREMIGGSGGLYPWLQENILRSNVKLILA